MDQPLHAGQLDRLCNRYRATNIQVVAGAQRFRDTLADQTGGMHERFHLVGLDGVDQRRQAAGVVGDNLIICSADARGDIVRAGQWVEKNDLLSTFRRFYRIGRADQPGARYECCHFGLRRCCYSWLFRG